MMASPVHEAVTLASSAHACAPENSPRFVSWGPRPASSSLLAAPTGAQHCTQSPSRCSPRHAVAAVSASSPCAVKLATALWMFHFSKRFLETLFVHSFSKASMPLTNLFKNCGYYYSAAALVAWDVARRGDVGISKAAAVAGRSAA